MLPRRRICKYELSPGLGPPSVGRCENRERLAMQRHPIAPPRYRSHWIGPLRLPAKSEQQWQVSIENIQSPQIPTWTAGAYSRPLGQFLRAILPHRIYGNHPSSLRIDSAGGKPNIRDRRRLRGGLLGHIGIVCELANKVTTRLRTGLILLVDFKRALRQIRKFCDCEEEKA